MASKYLPLFDERVLKVDVPNVIFDFKINKNELWTPKAVFVSGDGEKSLAAVYGTAYYTPANSNLEFIIDHWSFDGESIRRSPAISAWGNGDRFKLIYTTSAAAKVKTLIQVTIESNVPATTLVDTLK